MRWYRVIYRVEKNRVSILTVRIFAQLPDEEELDAKRDGARPRRINCCVCPIPPSMRGFQ